MAFRDRGGSSSDPREVGGPRGRPTGPTEVPEPAGQVRPAEGGEVPWNLGGRYRVYRTLARHGGARWGEGKGVRRLVALFCAKTLERSIH